MQQPVVRVEEQEAPTQAEILQQREAEQNASLQKFAATLKQLDPVGAPSFEVLQNWKSKHGNIYMSNVTEENEVFIWRPILRLEWKEMLSVVDMGNEILRQDNLLARCLLYPHIDKLKYKLGAGYGKSVESAIMYQSGFVDERYVISSIRIIE